MIVYSPMGSGLLTGAMTRERIEQPARRRLAQARPRASRSRSSPSTSPSSSGSRPSPTGTTRTPARSRSPGRCATPPSTARSSASAGPIRSTRSSPPPTSSSSDDDIATIEGSSMKWPSTNGNAIGFVGLGHDGREHGRPLPRRRLRRLRRGANRDEASGSIDKGLRWRDTPREVAEAADFVFTSLPNDDVLEAVASGPDGILAGLAPGKIWVDMSTVSPRASRDARRAGARDAARPCSTRRSPEAFPRCSPGTLTIMVGGDERAYERVEPVLRELGTPDPRRRERPGPGAQARDQHQPRRADARLLRGPAARRARRHRPRARARRDDAEPDRLADAQGARSAGPRPARGGLVRHRPDAQGHPPRAGDRAASCACRCPSAAPPTRC